MKRLCHLAVLCGAVSVLAQPGPTQTLESPRLQALQGAIGQGSTEAVDAFWREIATKTTPVIERTEEHKTYALVTFIWRGDSQTRNVLVGGALGQLTGTRAVDNLMTRLGDTNVWYRSYWLRKDARTVYVFVPNLSLDPAGEPTPESAKLPPHLDPLNPKRFLTSPDPGPSMPLSLLELPDARSEEWLTSAPNTKKGHVEQHDFKSTTLKNDRQIWVYLPPDYSATAEPYPLMITTDGASYTSSIPSPTILDNLIGAKRLPPAIAVFVGNAQGARSRELGCHEPFADFLVKEILPWIRARYRVTTDRARTVIAGLSLGGLTAACTALKYPAVFGNVLSQSGSFWWKPAGDEEGEWVSRQVASRPKLPVRWYLSVGLLEMGTPGIATLDWQSRTNIPYSPSMLVVNRHLRDMLKAKGYEIHYAEVGGGHNGVNWRSNFGDAILALLGTTESSTR